MEVIIALASGALLVAGLCSLAVAVRFVTLLRQPAFPDVPDSKLPRALVLLSLRGSDPYLAQCLSGLARQNYPRYTVKLILDSPGDSARAHVDAIVAQFPHGPFEIEFCEKRLPTCSRKCESLVQALRGLEEDVEFIALIDADVLAHENWLRELVIPMLRESIGGTTGHRWFFPESTRIASWVRAQWNAAAVMLMTNLGLSWGGSMAFKSRLIRETDILKRWSLSLAEDTQVRDVLQSIGLEMRPVPNLIMVNREDCTLPRFFRWATRQTLMAKLYHRYPNYQNMFLSAVFHGVTVAAVAGGLALLYRGEPSWRWLFLGLAVMFALQGVAIGLGRATVRRVLAAAGRPIPQPPVWPVLLVPLTGLLAAAVWLVAQVQPRVFWRGAWYRCRGPYQVTLLSDTPPPSPVGNSARESL